jgi:predicted N-formylglutamate amidohydrolase
MESVLTSPLLTSGDPAPVKQLNAQSAAPMMLLCEHAGCAIPKRLNDLGVGSEVLKSHRGWDVGAEALARAFAVKLDAPLVLQRYSRLVIDANRPPHSTAAFPEISDGVAIPGNHALPNAARATRIAEIFEPMNAAIDAVFSAHPR